MARQRAYPGARIKAKDGRRGSILSAFSDGLGSWLVRFDARTDRGETEGDLCWVKRTDFCLMGEEWCPW